MIITRVHRGASLTRSQPSIAEPDRLWLDSLRRRRLRRRGRHLAPPLPSPPCTATKADDEAVNNWFAAAINHRLVCQVKAFDGRYDGEELIQWSIHALEHPVGLLLGPPCLGVEAILRASSRGAASYRPAASGLGQQVHAR